MRGRATESEEDTNTSEFTNRGDSVTHHARDGERFTSNNQGLRLASIRTSKPYSSARSDMQRAHISGERERLAALQAKGRHISTPLELYGSSGIRQLAFLLLITRVTH